MANYNSFDDENLVDQPEFGFYTYNAPEFPEDKLFRQQSSTGMGGGMMNQTPVQTPGMMQQSPPSGSMVMAPVLANTAYTQGFLRTLIGKRVRVSFLIGTSLLVDRVGTLLEVGTSYIVLKQMDSNIKVMCDLYSIKFVDIFNA